MHGSASVLLALLALVVIRVADNAEKRKIETAKEAGRPLKRSPKGKKSSWTRWRKPMKPKTSCAVAATLLAMRSTCAPPPKLSASTANNSSLA